MGGSEVEKYTQQDVDTKRKGSHHITSHHISADRSPSRAAQLNSGGKSDRCQLVGGGKKIRCFGKHRGAKCGWKISCGQSRIYLGLSWRRTLDVAATRGSVDLKITATKQSERCTWRKTNFGFTLGLEVLTFPLSFKKPLSQLLFFEALLWMREQSPEPLQDRQRSADDDRLRRQGPEADENNVKEDKSRRKRDPKQSLKLKSEERHSPWRVMWRKSTDGNSPCGRTVSQASS